MAQEQVVVGIDVAKEKVDVAIRRGAEGCFANDPRGRRQLLAWLKEHAVGQAVMEASGGYEKSWTQLLRKAGIEVVIVDPKRVRHFAKSAGQLAKNDPIDARMIAWFGEAFEHRGKPEDAAREELDQLVTARRGLSRLKDKIDNWGEHEQPRAVQKAYQALLREVDRQQARLEALIADRIEKTEHFAERAEIIQSVPGLAGNSAAALLAFLPELGQVDRQAASALLGVAPFDDDSGKRRGHRHIQGGRRKLRCMLFTPILGAATRHNRVLQDCYRRLIAKCKEHKVALVACMRKLICILNTMLARGEKWDPARYAPA